MLEGLTRITEALGRGLEAAFLAVPDMSCAPGSGAMVVGVKSLLDCFEDGGLGEIWAG